MWSEEWGYGYTGWHIRGSISDIMPSNSDSNTGSESSSSSLSEPTWNRYEYGNNPQFDLRCMLDFGLPYPEVGTDYNWFVNFYDEFIADIESSVSKSVGRVPGEMFGDLFDLGWDLLDAISEEGTEIPLQRQKKINQIFYEWNQRFKNSYTKFIGFGVSGYQYNSIEAKVMNITDTLITDGLSRLIDVFAQDSTGTLSSLLVPRTPHYDPDDIILNIAVAYKYDDFTPKDGTLKFGHFGSLFNHRELKDSYYLMNMEVQIRQNQIIEASLNIWEYSPNPLTFNTKSKLFRQLGMSTY